MLANKASRFVMIIDDEEAVREAVSDILEFEGVPVLTAVDGITGITLFQQHHHQVDLVILDLSMPGLNGVDTFQELRQINPGVQVILSSGYDEAEATRHFVGQGLVGFLQKPYNMKNLVRKVMEYLGR